VHFSFMSRTFVKPKKLFADAGIPNAWAWIDKHRGNKKIFVEEIREIKTLRKENLMN